jgi:hypothetical protein
MISLFESILGELETRRVYLPESVTNPLGPLDIMGFRLFITVRPEMVDCFELTGRLLVTLESPETRYRNSTVTARFEIIIDPDGSNAAVLRNDTTKKVLVPRRGYHVNQLADPALREQLEESVLAQFPRWMDGNLQKINEQQFGFAKYWCEELIAEAEIIEKAINLLRNGCAKRLAAASKLENQSSELFPDYVTRARSI